MMASTFLRTSLSIALVVAVSSFTTHLTRTHHVARSGWRVHSTNGEDEFDPLLSPHAYANGPDEDPVDPTQPREARKSTSSGFGFDIGPLVSDGDAASAATADSAITETDDFDFDPLLSPHSYANGADEAPGDKTASVIRSRGSTSTFGFDTGAYDAAGTATDTGTTTDFDFDPLLSPHAYTNGPDETPVDTQTNANTNGGTNSADEMELFDPFPITPTTSTITTQKLGILLIDHGSKRQASNEHIHNIAQMYENRLNENNVLRGGDTTIVRAAHMEISEPSILDSLRNIIAIDRVDKVVCVPYFLSPGRHATEDVPELIKEARGVLEEEGMGSVDVMMSNALGTHLKGMLGAVDVLVEQTLMNEGYTD